MEQIVEKKMGILLSSGNTGETSGDCTKLNMKLYKEHHNRLNVNTHYKSESKKAPTTWLIV